MVALCKFICLLVRHAKFAAQLLLQNVKHPAA